MNQKMETFSEKRWVQHFQHFQKAFTLLREPFEEKELTQFSPLEQEGLVQRYEFCFKLAWKTLKDYLEYTGIIVDPMTPRNTIKQGFSAKIIDNGKIWIEMLEKRNLLSHTYDQSIVEKTLPDLKMRYLPILDQLNTFFTIQCVKS